MNFTAIETAIKSDKSCYLYHKGSAALQARLTPKLVKNRIARHGAVAYYAVHEIGEVGEYEENDLGYIESEFTCPLTQDEYHIEVMKNYYK